MHLLGIKCPICQDERDMPIEEFGFVEAQEKNQSYGIACAKCVNCNSRFEVTIPIIIGSEITLRRLDQTSQGQTDKLIQGEPHFELPPCEYYTSD